MHARGFTLVEMLVAIGLMALMAGLSWRGIDGMGAAQTHMQQRSDEVLTLQAGWRSGAPTWTPWPRHP